jgi:hypothetical protein
LLGAQTDFASFSALPLACSAVHSGTAQSQIQRQKQKQKQKQKQNPEPKPKNKTTGIRRNAAFD